MLREIPGHLQRFDIDVLVVSGPLLTEQRRRLTERIAGLEELVTFIDEKTGWLKDPDGRPPPRFPG